MKFVTSSQAVIIRGRITRWGMNRIEAAYLTTLAGRRVQSVDDLTINEASILIGLPPEAWGDAVVTTLERHALEAS